MSKWFVASHPKDSHLAVVAALLGGILGMWNMSIKWIFTSKLGPQNRYYYCSHLFSLTILWTFLFIYLLVNLYQFLTTWDLRPFLFKQTHSPRTSSPPDHTLTEKGVAEACTSTRLILVAGRAPISSTENQTIS